jgi:hypothetical protein
MILSVINLPGTTSWQPMMNTEKSYVYRKRRFASLMVLACSSWQPMMNTEKSYVNHGYAVY